MIATNQPGGGGGYPTQDGFGWTDGVMLKLMALYRPTPILKAPIFVPPDTAVEAGLVRIIAVTRRSLAAAHDAPGACAAIKPAKSAARTTLRAFTPASRPRASTS